MLNPDGVLNELAGPELAGLDRFAGRKKAADLLRAAGALVKEEPYENNVGYSERADVPIEPRLTMQWWLRYPRVEEAKAAVRDGHIKFYPGALGEGLPPLARQHPGLVHQPPAVVGPPHPGVVPEGHRPGETHRGRPPRSGEGARFARRPGRSGELGAGGGRARHLGVLLALAVRHHGLAGPGRDGSGRLRFLLPDNDPRHGPRHHLLLGGADDHGRPRIRPARRAAGAAHPVPERLFHRDHPRPPRAARCQNRSATRPIRST